LLREREAVDLPNQQEWALPVASLSFDPLPKGQPLFTPRRVQKPCAFVDVLRWTTSPLALVLGGLGVVCAVGGFTSPDVAGQAHISLCCAFPLSRFGDPGKLRSALITQRAGVVV